MGRAVLIRHRRRRPLPVVGEDHRVRGAGGVRIPHPPQQGGTGHAAVGQGRAVLVGRRLVAGVGVLGGEGRQLPVGGVGEPGRAVLVRGGRAAGAAGRGGGRGRGVLDDRGPAAGRVVGEGGRQPVRAGRGGRAAGVVVACRGDQRVVRAGRDRVRPDEAGPAVGSVVGGGRRAADRVVPGRGVGHAGVGPGPGRAAQRAGPGRVVVAVAAGRGEDVGGGVVDRLRLRQHGRRGEGAQARLPGLEADVLRGRAAQPVVDGPGERLRPARQRLDHVPGRVVPGPVRRRRAGGPGGRVHRVGQRAVGPAAVVAERFGLRQQAAGVGADPPLRPDDAAEVVEGPADEGVLLAGRGDPAVPPVVLEPGRPGRGGVHVGEGAGEVPVPAGGPAVVLVGRDQDHVVAAGPAAAGVRGGRPGVVGADVSGGRQAPHVEHGEGDRPARRDRAVAAVAEVVAEGRLVVVRPRGPLAGRGDRVVDAGRGQLAAVRVEVRRPGDVVGLGVGVGLGPGEGRAAGGGAGGSHRGSVHDAGRPGQGEAGAPGGIRPRGTASLTGERRSRLAEPVATRRRARCSWNPISATRPFHDPAVTTNQAPPKLTAFHAHPPPGRGGAVIHSRQFRGRARRRGCRRSTPPARLRNHQQATRPATHCRSVSGRAGHSGHRSEPIRSSTLRISVSHSFCRKTRCELSCLHESSRFV